MRIGYVGLGNIGGAIARRLHASGFYVTVWARRPEATQPFHDLGMRTVSSLEDLAATSDVVGVCVVDDPAVLAVCDDRLLGSLRTGARIVVQSTVLPSTCRRVAAWARPRGCAVVDAPVSGGADGATRGELSLAVGGARKDVDACSPMFEALGTWQHLGGLGTGQIAKLCSNVLYTATVGTTLSTLAAAEGLGLPAATLRRLLETTTARSFVTTRLPHVTDPTFVDHAITMLGKDLGLLRQLCDEDDVDASSLVSMAEEGLRSLKAWEGATWSDAQHLPAPPIDRGPTRVPPARG